MSDILTFDQKVDRLSDLSTLTLGPVTYPDPAGARRWWASLASVEIRDRGILQGATGFGPTPEAAVHELWGNLTQIPSGQYVVKNAYRDDRTAWRWSGTGWRSISEVPRAV